MVEKLFTFFSIAEFGVGSVISYRLYEQVAAKDEEKISKYMSMYKWAYRAVGLLICALAAVGAAALPWIMPGADLRVIYTVYGLNTLSTLSSYFLVTRRLMYTCTQQGYICTRIDFCFNVLTYLLRIAISLWWPNYVLYFGVTILLNTAANLTVAWRFRRTSRMCGTQKSRWKISARSASSATCATISSIACPTRSTARRIPLSHPAWAARRRPQTLGTTPRSRTM